MEENSKRKLTTILSQSYKGVVTSINENKVIIEFKVNDDLEERQYNRTDLSTSQPIKEGQVVQARCCLDLIPPRGPLSAKEIQRWKKEYSDTI